MNLAGSLAGSLTAHWHERHWPRGAAAAGVMLWLLAGCGSVPPHASTRGMDAAALVAAGTASAGWPAPHWWEQYGDHDLDALVERALQVAPSLTAAQARVAAAAAAISAAQADRKLQVSGDAQLERQRLSDNGLLPPKFLGFNWYSIADLGLNFSYSFDLSGRLAAGQRAAAASTAAAAAEKSVVELGIAHAVVATYFGWQTDHARQQLALERLHSLEHEKQIIVARLSAELARGDDLQQLELLRLATADEVGGYDATMQTRTIALAALLKVAPVDLPPLQVHALPAQAGILPERASLDLMSRRPDLRAARERIEGALANVDIARAGFLPDIDLHMLLGVSSRELGKLLQADSAAPSFAAAVHLPLFDAGRARARHAQSQSLLTAAVAEYNALLLTAAEEINDALADRDARAIQLRTRDRQIAAADQLRSLAQQRFDAGLSDARPPLAQTRRWLEARDAKLVTQFAQLATDLNLIRALGGGYGTDNERQR